jgi:hypothetical protein
MRRIQEAVDSFAVLGAGGGVGANRLRSGSETLLLFREDGGRASTRPDNRINVST